MGFVSDALGKGGGDAGQTGAAAANAAAELQVAELRRQFDVTQQTLAPFIAAGQGQLGALTEGTTVEGLDARLARIFESGAFSSLIGERTGAIEGQLGAGGLTRSGTAIEQAANIPTSLGFEIENLLTGRSQSLVNIGQGTAVNQASLGEQSASQIGQSIAQQGQNLASGLLADQQASAQALSNTISTGATAAAIFFSDPVLKENVEQISSIRDLPLYQWDWIPETKGTMIEKCGTIGFMADEVKEKYPQHVNEYCGLMIIDYPALLDEMDGKICQH